MNLKNILLCDSIFMQFTGKTNLQWRKSGQCLPMEGGDWPEGATRDLFGGNGNILLFDSGGSYMGVYIHHPIVHKTKAKMLTILELSDFLICYNCVFQLFPSEHIFLE